ncbi:MAG: GntR family transcription regulator [Acidimicrobiaceae bacterium]|jgi:DNA-binding FadR family transcriptional regulator|nr:GntR family transcription regulator [Acidimicrobiaceae bacterium]
MASTAKGRRRAHADPAIGAADSDSAAQADEVLFRPVRAGNAFEETVERLLGAVKLGLVTEGQRLPAERDLAARLEVSRMTLREAIRALQQAGFVESRRGRHGGTFVTARLHDVDAAGLPRRAILSAQTVSDTLAFREVVEVGAAGVAARRAPGTSDQVPLTMRLGECEDADLSGYRRADSRFHLAIAEATGSPSIVAAVADARMRVNDLLDQIPLLSANLAHSNEQHRAIVASVLKGDEAHARVAMSDHLSGSAALLRAFLA